MADSFTSLSSFSKLSFKGRLFIAIALLTQLFIFANGGLTLGVAFSSYSVFDLALNQLLPRLSLLNSMSWRNWKIMETMSDSLLIHRSGQELTLGAVEQSHEKMLDLESRMFFNLNTNPSNLLELVARLPSLREACYSLGNVTSEFDVNHSALDQTLKNMSRDATKALNDSLTHQLNLIQTTRTVNIVELVFVSVFKLVQMSLFPSMGAGRLSNLAGSGSLFALAALESSALILISSFVLNDLQGIMNREYPLYNTAWQIKGDDPILTSSAIRFALSQNGDAAWKHHYDTASIPFNLALSTFRSMSHSNQQALLQKVVDETNDHLVSLEMNAFSNHSAASEILMGASYTATKSTYLSAIDYYVEDQQSRLFAALLSSATLCNTLLFFAALILGMGFFVFVNDLSRWCGSQTTMNAVSEPKGLKGKDIELDIMSQDLPMSGSTSYRMVRMPSLCRESAVAYEYDEDLPRTPLETQNSQSYGAIHQR